MTVVEIEQDAIIQKQFKKKITLYTFCVHYLLSISDKLMKISQKLFNSVPKRLNSNI